MWAGQERVYEISPSNTPIGTMGLAFARTSNTNDMARITPTNHNQLSPLEFRVTSAGEATWWYGGNQADSSNVTRTDSYIPVTVMSGSTNNNIIITDSRVTFNEDRCLINIGDNSSQTGRFDPRFRKIITLPEFRHLNSVTINGVPAVINYDVFGEPSQGEVNVLPYSGRLQCSPADVGKTFAGSFVYQQDFN
jgi:hypothetical protein